MIFKGSYQLFLRQTLSWALFPKWAILGNSAKRCKKEYFKSFIRGKWNSHQYIIHNIICMWNSVLQGGKDNQSDSKSKDHLLKTLRTALLDLPPW